MKTQQEIDAVIGNHLINLLGLTVKANGRVDTAGGDKTPLGLALTVKRVIDENSQYRKFSDK